MTLKRMDNVLIVVDDLEAAKAFFIELGLTTVRTGLHLLCREPQHSAHFSAGSSAVFRLRRRRKKHGSGPLT